MLMSQTCQRIKLLQLRQLSTTQPFPKFENDPKKEHTHIKSGFITSVRLESGDDIFIVRPKNMKSIAMSPEVFERLNKCIKPTSSSTYIKFPDPVIINKESDIPATSIEELMTRNISADAQLLSLKERLIIYSKLGKVRLTTLVVISTLAGSLMAPVSFDISVLVLSGFGTFLTSMAANTVNQILEVPYDSQMIRTRNRPLVLGKISPIHASVFCMICATSGLGILCSCNPITCGLGLTNLLLYTAIYTPLKRASITNTWLGAIVGALPPLIGWSAATNGIHPGGLLLASILFCWQFPHFMALSWNLRKDYSRAGYQMASMVSPSLCKASALRHSLLLTAISTLAPVIGLTDWCFVVESLPFNVAMCVLAYQFYSNTTSGTSRRLFRYTLVYLPILMTLLILNKLQIAN